MKYAIIFSKTWKKEKIKKSTHLYVCILLSPRVKVIGAEDTKLTNIAPPFNSSLSSREKQRENNERAPGKHSCSYPRAPTAPCIQKVTDQY